MEQKTPIEIFSTPTCHFCHMAKDYFNENNIEFVEHDVSSDADKRKEMMEKTNQMGVPVIMKGDKFVVGFNKDQVEQLISES